MLRGFANGARDLRKTHRPGLAQNCQHFRFIAALDAIQDRILQRGVTASPHLCDEPSFKIFWKY